jgi:hypothetical protein
MEYKISEEYVKQEANYKSLISFFLPILSTFLATFYLTGSFDVVAFVFCILLFCIIFIFVMRFEGKNFKKMLVIVDDEVIVRKNPKSIDEVRLKDIIKVESFEDGEGIARSLIYYTNDNAYKISRYENMNDILQRLSIIDGLWVIQREYDERKRFLQASIVKSVYGASIIMFVKYNIRISLLLSVAYFLYCGVNLLLFKVISLEGGTRYRKVEVVLGCLFLGVFICLFGAKISEIFRYK